MPRTTCRAGPATSGLPLPRESSLAASLDPSPVWWFTAHLTASPLLCLASGHGRRGSRHVCRRARRSSPTAAWASLLTAAVPRLRSPEEANLRAPEAVVSLHVSFINAGAELIETNTFGANRRKLASHYLEDELERINSTAVKLAREARELTGPRRLHRRRDRPARGGGELGEAPRALRGAGRGARGPRRRPVHARDVLRPRGARRRDRGRPERLVAARSSRCSPSTRTRRRSRASPRAQAAERLAGLDVAAIGANHGAGLLAALTALEQMQATGPAARRAAEHRPREPARRQGDLPARDPGVLRRVRRACARPRRAGDRRLLRHDAGRDRRDPRGDRRGARRRGRGSTPTRARSRSRSARSSARRGSRRRSARASSSSRCSSTRRSAARAAGCSRSRRSSRRSGLVQFVDVNDNATARAGINALMVSCAIERATGPRDDPAPDDARLDRPRDRVAAPRRALGGRPQRARDHRRPARGRRLPGLAGRLRDRLDRADAADRAAEPRRGLQRPADRRADVVLHRRRGEPDARRPRGRGGALPGEGRGGRAVRDDADRLRPRRARPLRARSSAAGRSRCSRGSSRSRATGWRCGSTTRCRGSSSRDELQEALDEAGADAATVGMAHARRAARRGARSAATASTSSRRTASRRRCSSYLPDVASDCRREANDASCFWMRRTSCGGATSFRRWSTSDCRTSRCTFGWPGIWSATAPTTQQSASPQTRADARARRASRAGGAAAAGGGRRGSAVASERREQLEDGDADERADRARRAPCSASAVPPRGSAARARAPTTAPDDRARRARSAVRMSPRR